MAVCLWSPRRSSLRVLQFSLCCQWAAFFGELVSDEIPDGEKTSLADFDDTSVDLKKSVGKKNAALDVEAAAFAEDDDDDDRYDDEEYDEEDDGVLSAKKPSGSSMLKLDGKKTSGSSMLKLDAKNSSMLKLDAKKPSGSSNLKLGEELVDGEYYQDADYDLDHGLDEDDEYTKEEEQALLAEAGLIKRPAASLAVRKPGTGTSNVRVEAIVAHKSCKKICKKRHKKPPHQKKCRRRCRHWRHGGWSHGADHRSSVM